MKAVPVRIEAVQVEHFKIVPVAYSAGAAQCGSWISSPGGVFITRSQ
jgi:hypothetical protein